jgi:hypothetical protein
MCGNPNVGAEGRKITNLDPAPTPHSAGPRETAVPDGWPPARVSGYTEPGLQAGSPAA